MKSLEALEDIITIHSNIVGTNRCQGKTRFGMCVRQIKKDLEVLEILKKKKVEVLHLWYIIKTNEEKNNEYILMKYNESFGNQRNELTLEELLKLRQWLEE